jgi:hypothetical protein
MKSSLGKVKECPKEDLEKVMGGITMGSKQNEPLSGNLKDFHENPLILNI